MEPSGCAAQTVIHMTGRRQVKQEKLLFKVVPMERSVQTWLRNTVKIKRGSFINNRGLCDSGDSTSVTSQHHKLIFSSPPPLYEMSFI